MNNYDTKQSAEETIFSERFKNNENIQPGQLKTNLYKSKNAKYLINH